MKKFVFLTIAAITLTGCVTTTPTKPSKSPTPSTGDVAVAKMTPTKTVTGSCDTVTGSIDKPGAMTNCGVTPVETKIKGASDPVLHLSGTNFTFNEYIPTLMFHYIKDVPSTTSDKLYYGLSFSPQRLEKYLQYFQKHNIETLTYRDIKAIREGKKPMPKRAVMLTFDDGYTESYIEALPLLEKYKAKGTFFVISNRPGTPGYMTRDQIRALEKAGHDIGSHSDSHADLRYTKGARREKEIVGSKKIIEKEIGRPIIAFCYPAGKYDNGVVKMVQENYLFGRTTHPGKQLNYKNRYTLPMTRIFPTSGMTALRSRFPPQK